MRDFIFATGLFTFICSSCATSQFDYSVVTQNEGLSSNVVVSVNAYKRNIYVSTKKGISISRNNAKI